MGGNDDDVEEVVDLDDLEADDNNIFASDKFVSNEAQASGI